MSDAAILTEGFSKSFGARAAVSELNLRIQPGAVYGFLGRNGAGKTTTMRMLLGLVRPTKGSARVLGLDPTHETDLMRIKSVSCVGSSHSTRAPTFVGRTSHRR